MQQFIFHKCIVLLSIYLVWLSSYWFFPESAVGRWYVLLFVMTVFGYAHYIVGAVYQLKSYQRHRRPLRSYMWFLLFAVGSAGVAWWAMSSDQIGWFAFVVIGYFMLHGFYNEHTLYERQVASKADPYVVRAFVLTLSGLILLAVGHPSSFFDTQLIFLDISTTAIEQYLVTHTMPIASRWLGIVCLSGAFAMAIIATIRTRTHRWWYTGFVAIIVLASIISFVWYPLSYIVMLSSLLLYHFLVWFLFYFQSFYERSVQQLTIYIGIHIVVLLPFLALYFDSQTFDWVRVYILNSYTFLILTCVHITTAWLNEKGCKKMLGLG